MKPEEIQERHYYLSVHGVRYRADRIKDGVVHFSQVTTEKPLASSTLPIEQFAESMELEG